MFTGIIEEQGVVQNIERRKNLCILTIKSQQIFKGTKIGDSLAVNGVCLTITNIHENILTFDIMLETIRKTTLDGLGWGVPVNLERAMKENSRFDGHFVLGHVDDVGIIKKRLAQANYVEFRISIVKKLQRFLAPKGSICIDGVSLTIGEVKKDYFLVYLIPHTLKVTTLGKKMEKDKVNIEVDILARYILK